MTDYRVQLSVVVEHFRLTDTYNEPNTPPTTPASAINAGTSTGSA